MADYESGAAEQRELKKLCIQKLDEGAPSPIIDQETGTNSLKYLFFLLGPQMSFSPDKVLLLPFS